ncbi:Predicted nucleic acid-binding protein, contains PIN domain [Nitrosomonas ureae]|uniref:Ribonuclease VapC n=1 Tax=Nitrosomonas ureae TaxID=44577 RepID=A0A285BY05_9PROT|nr:PIN domain-containing protein [Nitrosomonas ureae]SNX60181.1 Predicted nucleic acid-binding protein, contains PIN domain [Nitrosomonas ureae]
MNGEFIDTNIFIYLFDETDDRKRAIANQLIQQALETRGACISYQVIQETLNVVTCKLPSPMSAENAQRFLEQVLIPLWQVMPTPTLYQRSLVLQQRYGFSFYDALIVSAALESGCIRLYTEDLQHNQQIDGLMIVNPFEA